MNPPYNTGQTSTAATAAELTPKMDAISGKLDEMNDAIKKIVAMKLIPDPPVLDGTESYTLYKQWQIKMRMKLATVSTSPDLQILYVASRLSGVAFEVVRPHLPFDMGAGKPLDSPLDIFNMLEPKFQEHKLERQERYNLNFGSLAYYPPESDGRIY